MTLLSSKLENMIRQNVKDESTMMLIQQLIAQEREPAEIRSRHLKQLHRLATTPYDSLQQMFQSYLKVGCEVLGIRQGIVSRIENNVYHVQASYPNVEEINRRYPLHKVICKITVQEEQTQVFTQMNSMLNSPKPDNPALNPIENYLGTPLTIENKTWGTICFYDDQANKDSFSSNDIEFIELIAQGVSNALQQTIRQEKQVSAETRYQLLFENINTPAILYDAVSGEILDANIRALSFYGYERDAFLKLTPDDLNMIPADDIEEILYQSRQEKRPYIRVPHRLKSGEIREVDVYINDLMMNGRAVRFAIIYDYTERQTATEALKLSEAYLHAIFNSTSQLMFLVNNKRQISTLNRSAKQFIALLDDHTPRPDETLHNFSLSAERYLASEYIQLALEGKTVSHEAYIQLRHKQKLYIDFRYVPIKTPDDQIIGVCIVGQDITKLKLSQEALSRERNMLRTLIDTLPDSIFIKDSNGRVLTANQQYVKTTQQDTLDAVIGKNAIELFPTYGEQYYTDDVAVLSSGTSLRKHEKVILQDGSNGIYDTTKIPLRDKHQHTVGLVGIRRNITEQEAMRAALSRRDKILYTISDASQLFLTQTNWRDSILHILEKLGDAIGIDRVYIYENVDMEQGLGNKPLYEWSRDDIQNHSDLRAEPILRWQLSRWLDKLKQGKPVYGQLNDMEPDEQTIIRQRHIQSLVIVPIHVGNYWWGIMGFDAIQEAHNWYPVEVDALMTAGRTLGAAIQREQMEQGLRENEEKFTQLITHIPEAFWIYDIEQQDIIFASDNYEKIFGIPVEERRKDIQLFIERVHPEDRPVIETNLQRQSRGEVSDYEIRFLDNEDNIRWVNIRHYPITAGSTTARVAGIAADITERKQAEQNKLEMLAQRERISILSQFIRDATHEFKTPISIINTRLYLIEKTDDPEVRHNNLQLIHEQISGISDLIESLVLMSRLDSRADLTFNLMNTNSIVRQVLSAARNTYDKRQGDFVLTITENVPPVIGHINYIHKAVYNLIENAVRYSDAGTPIEIRTKQNNEFVMIEVEDHGMGILPEEMSEIFKRFFRRDTAHSTRGFGLGLPIAQRIIQRHGGHITVESVPDEGSTFCIYLPKLKIANE